MLYYRAITEILYFCNFSCSTLPLDSNHHFHLHRATTTTLHTPEESDVLYNILFHNTQLNTIKCCCCVCWMFLFSSFPSFFSASNNKQAQAQQEEGKTRAFFSAILLLRGFSLFSLFSQTRFLSLALSTKRSSSSNVYFSPSSTRPKAAKRIYEATTTTIEHKKGGWR